MKQNCLLHFAFCLFTQPQFELIKERGHFGPYRRALGQQIFGYICEPPHKIPGLGEAQRL